MIPTYKFACPNCEQRILAEVNVAGMRVSCPSCGSEFEAPALEQKTGLGGPRAGAAQGEMAVDSNAAQNIGDLQAIEPLVESLMHHRDNAPKTAVEALASFAGHPRDGEHRATWLIACEEIEAAVCEQAAAVGPLIIEALGQGMRERAVRALGMLRDQRAVEPLIAMLNDLDDRLRLVVVEALESIGDPRCEEPLVRMLQDSSPSVRVKAIRALGRIGGAKAVGPLISALADHPSGQAEAAEALGRIGDSRAVEPLINALQMGSDYLLETNHALKSLHSHARSEIASALGEIGGLSAVPILITTLQDKDPKVGHSAANALCKIGNHEALASVRAALENSDFFKGSTGTVKKIAYQQASDQQIIAVLKTGGDHDANLAAEVLDNFGTRQTVALLISELENSKFAIAPWRPRVIRVLGKFGGIKEVVCALLGVLQLKRGVKEEWVTVTTLGEIGDWRAADTICEILLDPKRSFDARIAAAIALGKIGGEKAIESLITVLKDRHASVRRNFPWLVLERYGPHAQMKSPVDVLAIVQEDDVRCKAVSALGALRDLRTVEPLIDALEDRSMPVRKAAVASLGSLGDCRAVEPLIKSLNDSDMEVRRLACSALGSLKDARAVRPLIALSQNKTSNEWQAATLALGEIGDVSAVEPLLAVLNKRREAMEAKPLPMPGYWRSASLLSDFCGPAGEECIVVSLGKIGDVRAVGPLLEAFSDPCPGLRKAALSALVNMAAVSFGSIVAALSSPNADIRYGAATVLGEIGDVSSIEPLLALRNEDHYAWVCQAAEDALKKLGFKPGPNAGSIL